jgi:hypothetical protein
MMEDKRGAIAVFISPKEKNKLANLLRELTICIVFWILLSFHRRMLALVDLLLFHVRGHDF